MADELDLSDPEIAEQVQGLNPNIRQALHKLGDVERARLEAESRAQQAERLLAVERAGLPNTPVRDLFLKSYDGPADPTAIKTEWEKLGVGEAPPATASELEGLRAVQSAAAGSMPPAQAGDQDALVALRNAKSPAEVMAIVAQMPNSSRDADGRIYLPTKG